MRVYRRSEEGYEEARLAAIWNLRKPARYPAMIVQAEHVDDVVAAVRLARDEGLQIKVKGTGHNRMGSFLVEDSMMLDGAGLRELSLDPSTRTAVVGPGIYGGQLNTAAVAE